MNLGIDFGTSYTKMGFVDRQGQFVNLLGADGMIPTVAAFVPRTGRLYWGQAATGLREEGIRVGRFFKLEIKRNPDYRLGPYRLHEILQGLFEHLYRQYIEGKLDEPLSAVTLSVPNYFGLQARRVILEAARRVFPGLPVRLVLEPLAALVGMLQERQQSGLPPLTGDILVVDIGGGTADASFVRVTGGGETRLVLDAHLQAGGDAFSGAEVDKAILRRLLLPRLEKQIGARLPDAFYREKGFTPEEEYQYARMLGWAEETKLQLGRHDCVQLDFPGFYREHSLHSRLGRQELAPVLASTLVSLKQFLETSLQPRAWGLGLYSDDTWHLDLVLLVGGAARLPGVSEVLAGLKTRILQPEEPEFYVVKGLSHLGGERSPEGMEMRGIFPFCFYIEKLMPGPEPTTTLEPVPFDTANLELDPQGTYRICTVDRESVYNLAREEGRFRLRVYQGGEGSGEDPAGIKADPESLVLDLDAPIGAGTGMESVEVYLDLGASCLRTSLDDSEKTPLARTQPTDKLWRQALLRQQETVAAVCQLKNPQEAAVKHFAARLGHLQDPATLPYQNYDELMTAKLLTLFEILTKETSRGRSGKP